MNRVGNNAIASLAVIICIAFVYGTIMPFSLALADTTPPITNATATGTLGSNNWYISNVSMNFTATDDLAGVNRTLYSLDGAPYVNYTANFTLSDGNHTLLYYSVDNASNSELIKRLNVKVDTRAPSVNIAIQGNQTSGGWYNGTTTVNLTASDAMSGIALLAYSLDSGAWAPYSGNITLGDGTHTFAYGCTDRAGNAYNNTVNIDVSNPSVDVVLSGTQLSNGWFTSDVLVSFIASGGAGGVNHVEYSFNGKNWTTGSTFTITGEGWNRTFYRAVDNMGMTGDTHILWVAIDKSAPTISISIDGSMTKSKGWYNGDIEITLNANDNGSIATNGTQYGWDNTTWTNYTGKFKVAWSRSRPIFFRTTDAANNTVYGSQFIYFRPVSIDMGTLGGSVYVAGSTPTPTATPTATPTITPTPTKVPIPTPTLTPEPTGTDLASGSGNPMAIAVLVGVLALLAIGAAAAYLFMAKK